MLNEDYNIDNQNRQLAKSIAKAIFKGLSNPKISYDIVQNMIVVDLTEEISSLSPILNPYKYGILICNSNIEPDYACSEASDGKSFYIMVPWIDNNPQEYISNLILKKHKRKTESLYLKEKQKNPDFDINSFVSKLGQQYLRQEIFTNAKYSFDKYSIDTFIHECTHLIDKVRRKKKYRPKPQEFNTKQGLINYYNSPEEFNAFYQQTLYEIDDLLNDKIISKQDYQNFEDFFVLFLLRYKGNSKYITDENMVRLKKRVYNYWKNNFSMPKYHDFSNPKN